jgi:nicotinate-nucleotide adenylyltransferase
MGGTFDPIHDGHLFIAEASRVACRLDRVLWIPNRQPAHREGKNAHAEAEIRYDLTVAATRDNPHFEVSRVELDRPGPSFAIDTLRHFHAQGIDGNNLFWILGADAINDVPTWHRSGELFSMCRFIACNRPGFDLRDARREMSEEQNERVTWLELPGLHIASRDLRQRVRDGQPIRYLLPDAVREEIERRGLYRD